LIPLSHIGGDSIKEEALRERLDFLKRFLEALLGGFGHDEIKSFSEELIVGYFECIYYIALKRLLPIYQEEKWKHLKKSVKGFLY
jgi:hypothetical protein